MHSGDSKVFRVASYDAMVSESGSVVSASREGLTSILPGKGSKIVMEDVADGAVHRGVSPVARYGHEGVPRVTLPLMLGTVGDGSLRGVVPGEMGVGQWSVRVMMDAAPSGVPSSLAALSISAERDEAWRVRVGGVPAGTTIGAMAIETAEGWWELRSSTRPGLWEASGNAAGTALGPWARHGHASRTDAYGRPEQFSVIGLATGVVHIGSVWSLPGAASRRDAISRLVGSGRWVCVHALCNEWPSDVKPISRSGAAWGMRSQAVLRLLVPVEAPGSVSTPASTETPASPTDQGMNQVPGEVSTP